jgi:hypothetical protein
MDISNKFRIIENHHRKLLERYHAQTTTIAQLTAAGCIDAKEYWKDKKYLYLLYSMKNGIRRKKYVGNHPLRIKEARQKVENYKDRLYHIEVQNNVQSSLDEIEMLTTQILRICADTDMSARFALNENDDGYIEQLSRSSICTHGQGETIFNL